MKNVARLLFLFTVAACLLALPRSACAAPVTADQAQSAVRHWLAGNPGHFGAKVRNSIVGVTTYPGPTGSPLYHVVSLAPSGFVVAPADDRLEPILCFSSDGVFDPSDMNPLVELVCQDVQGRLSKVNNSNSERNQSKWQSLLGLMPDATSVTLPTDVWVSPFIQSQWNQGYPTDVECYNYYTPDNYYTGCVATALAQLMRFWQWPQTGVGTASFPIYINGTAANWALRGGDGNGGPYDWAEMPYTPDTVSLTTQQYDEVGDISADAGVAVNMQYGPDGSGAYLSSAQSALVSVFDYSNAILSGYDPTDANLEQEIYPDLDAGMPVILGIENASEGHCVLADGYGEDSGTFYTHLNVGWGTSADASNDIWYNLADPDITVDDFNVISQTIYNVTSQGSGETISGMLLNAAGAFLPGVTVSISGGGVSQSTASSTQQGIYAFTDLPSNTQYTISATYQGQPQSITVTTGQSSNYGACGNLWAQNLTFANVAAVPTFSPAAGTYASAQTVTISDATPGSAIYYTTDGTIPTTSSTEYTAPITTVSSGNETISAIATASGDTASSVGSAAYTIGNPAPVLSSVSPASASAGSAQFTLTATGSSFVSGSVVKWNGSALSTTFVSATELTATVPASLVATAGTASVTVYTATPGGGTSTAATFTINNPSPALSAISPTSALAGAAQLTLTATGSGFVSSSVVKWNGSALSTTFVSATELTATVPASSIATAGTATVTVYTATPGGGTSSAATFTINNPAPALSAISPTSALAGAAQLTLTATGSGFASGSVVKWNGSALSTTFVSATELTATVPASLVATAGTASVTVYTATPGGGTSSAATFTINNPAPVLSAISPTSASAGAAQFTLTATGSSFVSGSVVKWNGSALSTTFVSATELTATVPASSIATAGTATVTVYTATPGGGTSTAATFTIGNPAPVLSAISPTSALAGAAQLTLTATGSGFVSGSVVQWNGSALSTTYVSATELTATVPASLLATAGTASVTVYTATPGGGTSAAATFTIGNPAPVLSAISPTSALAGAAQLTLMATGSGFVSGSVVKWNGSALSTTFVSAAELTAAVPASSLATAGTASVTVYTATPGGGTSAAATFTIGNPAPVLSAISPTSALAGAAQLTLTATGSAFASGSVVKWNGSALSTTYVSATELTATVPASLLATAGTASVTVYTATPGGGTSAAATFTIGNPAPVLSAISPTSALAGAAQLTLTATGSAFASGSVVKWNGSALSTTYVSATELTATVPASLLATAGTASVTVYTATPGGGTSAAATFTIGNPAPVLSAISPTSALAGAAQLTLTATGSGFASGCVVKWNGSALSTTYVSATELTATVPASLLATAGTASVTVYTASPGGGTSAAATFTITNSAANAVPVLSSITPSSATAGSTAFTLTAVGSSFVAGSVVQWNGSALSTTFVSATELTATVPASYIATAGTASVTVYTASPGGGTSAAAAFTIASPPANPAPMLSSISPTSALAGSAACTLTVNGSKFVSKSVVRWNGTALSTSFVSATRLTATVAADLIATAGTASVTVFTPTPGGGTSGAAIFTITNPAPALSSISPTSVQAGSAKFSLIVSGSKFVSKSVVRWNGTALSTSFVSATRLTATVPADLIATAGTASVTVYTPAPGGGTSGAAIFTIANPAPALSSISPTSVQAGSAKFSLIVSGSKFVSKSVVRWNGTALSTSFVSATRLTATVPADLIATAGTASVTVYTPAPGGGTSGAAIFTIANPAPALSSISPTSVQAGSAKFSLIVSGSKFVSKSVVRWNGTALSTSFVSATRLTATVPADLIATAGTASVTVYTPAPGGGTSGAAIFTIANPAPALSSISPTSVQAGSAKFSLIVSGSKFVSKSVVRWNGTALSTTLVSSTKLTATAPATPIGKAATDSVTVYTPGPGGGTSAAARFMVKW